MEGGAAVKRGAMTKHETYAKTRFLEKTKRVYITQRTDTMTDLQQTRDRLKDELFQALEGGAR